MANGGQDGPLVNLAAGRALSEMTKTIKPFTISSFLQ